MDINAGVYVNFARVDVNFQTNTVSDLILLYIFFIFMSINIKVLLILHTKFQPNILSHFGERDLNAWVDVKFLGST